MPPRSSYAGFQQDRGALKALPGRAVRRQPSGVRCLEQAAAPGVSDQRVQRLHRRADPHPLPGPEIDPRSGLAHPLALEEAVLHPAGRAAQPGRRRARHDSREGRLRRPAHSHGGRTAPPSAARRCGRKPTWGSGSTRNSTIRCCASSPIAPATATARSATRWRCPRSSSGTRADFEQGYRGIDSPAAFFAAYAAQLADRPEDQQAIRAKTVKIRYLEYDWALNDRR